MDMNNSKLVINQYPEDMYNLNLKKTMQFQDMHLYTIKNYVYT